VDDLSRDRLECDRSAQADRDLGGVVGRDDLVEERHAHAVGTDEPGDAELAERAVRQARHEGRYREVGRAGHRGWRGGAYRVVLGDQGQDAQGILEAVEVDVTELAQRPAGGVRRRSRGERDHHRLLRGPGGLADETRATDEERHRGQDGEAVAHGRIAEENAGGVTGDLGLLRRLAPAEVDRVVGLRR
jgi:hypothetical protein